jgi:hypothetical protein
LNPILGFCFPLFSRVFPGEFPSAWKTVEDSGRKSVVNCSQSTYIVSARFNISYTFLARGKLGITRFALASFIFGVERQPFAAGPGRLDYGWIDTLDTPPPHVFASTSARKVSRLDSSLSICTGWLE